MKKIVVTFAVIASMLLCSVPVSADMGIPSQSDFTVVTDINGVPYYADNGAVASDQPSGYLDGGTAFYVYFDYGNEGLYYGTTETPKDPKNFDKFIYIHSYDTVSPGENIPPEVGEKSDEEINAKTTDPLNLRVGPGTGFKVIKTLEKGQKVSYNTTFVTDGEWAYVKAGNDQGWVFTEYLKEIEKKEPAKDEDKEKEAEEETAEPQAADEQNDPALTQEAEKEPVKSKTTLIAGIICVCVGAALLIAALAYYLLRKRENRG